MFFGVIRHSQRTSNILNTIALHRSLMLPSIATASFSSIEKV